MIYSLSMRTNLQKRSSNNMGTQIIPLRFGGDNCYVIENGSHAVLVDTGRNSTREKLLAALKPWDIELILLTHGHFDHTYNAAFLAQKFDAKIALHVADARLVRDNRIHKIDSRGPVGYFIKKVSIANINRIYIEPFEPAFYLQDGQDLRPFGIDAQIIALPGHTVGSIGILSGKACIVGDTLMNICGVSRARIAEDFRALDRSIGTLKRTDAEIFYPGHGGPVERKRLLNL
jgi:hydroxyacylglutathione hydrolase